MSFEAALTTLYRDFLLREPDADGLAYWNSALTDESLSLENVADQMLNSDEFQSDVQPVMALYAQILQRPADAEGLQYWVSVLRQGTSLDAIGDAMKASEEAQAGVMTLDDAAWLTNAYSSLLAREPDAEGFAYWLEQLENGVSRDAVSQSINASEEASELAPTQVVGTLLSSDTPEQALENYLTELLETDAEPAPSEPEVPEEPAPETPLALGERYHQGTSDASTAIAVGERLMLVADDEDQTLRLYNRDADGEPLASVNLNNALGLNDTQEADLEAVATLDGVQYWLGSHESAQRSMLFATRITGDDADSLNIEVEGQFTALAEQLQAWDANNDHGLGANAKSLATGINVEGAAFVGDTLMLGLRAPLDNGLAQVIPINNAPSLVSGETTEADIGAPLRLDLEGRVIRAIEPAGDGSYLVLAGPENDDDEQGFALYQWDGAHAVRQVEGPDLNAAPNALTAKPETLFDVQATESGFTAGVLYDSGTVDWLGDGQESKDLPAEQQRFIGVDIEFAALPGFSPRPGDIAITAVQTDNPDEFQFVTLKGIAAGAEITFTDSGWAGDSFRANEGAVTWTAPAGGVAPGTLISFTEQVEQFRESNGEAVGNNGFNLSGSGDQVIAFTGTPEAPTFLFAVQTNSNEWQESASSSNDSGLPPGLEEGVTAVAVGESVDAEYDNAAYVGTGNGTAAELLSAIANPANWAGDNTALPSVATQDFQIGTMEEIYVPGNRDIGLVISEIWSGQSGPDVTEDWFEITNRSLETLDLTTTPLYYDDDSADPEDAVQIQGLDALAPGETAVVMVDGNADSVAEFRAAWSNLDNIDSLKIGYAEDASGLGGGGDAVTLWLGDPRTNGDQVASAAYPDTDGFDAAAWDVDAGRFISAEDSNAESSSALGGDDSDVPAVATPGSTPELAEQITLISAIQGASDVSPLVGESVTVEAVVTMVAPGMDGFFLQEEDADNDGDADTSEGIFVYTGSESADWLNANLEAGQQIRISGEVAEFFNKTQLSADRDSLEVLESGLALPSSQRIEMPFTDKDGLEAFEGMRVAIEALDGEPLTVTELYQLGRFGEVTLSSGGRLEQFTEVNSPDAEGYTAWLDDAESRTIKIDDANSTQNPDPVIYGRNGEELSADNPLRGGDELAELEGVLDFSFGEWKVQNVEGLDFSGPERPATPDAEALGNPDITVASFNVLNYFTTLDEEGNKTVTMAGTEHGPRGADNAEEFARQEAKLVEAINASGADVVGLMEIENNGYGDNSAIAALVDALNAEVGEGVNWAYSVPQDAEGNVVSPGDDAIAVGMIYNSEAVTPVGAAATKTDGAFESANRAPLLQTFEDNATGEVFSAVVNHFKSKGSVVNDENAIGDGQGNNNPTRVEAAEELRDWLASDPTGSGDSDVLIIGDLNAYAMEDPITTLEDAGYSRVNDDYSYVFDGFWGSLDHALASDSLQGQVTGTTTWHINADEASALDYNTDFTNDRQDENLYAADAFRSSDHDPVLVGLDLSSDPEENFQLQLLHAADMEGGGSDLLNAPNFVAIVDYLEDQYANTLTVSSGDLVLPGPYLTAAADGSLQPALQAAAEAIYGLDAGSLSGIGAEAGRVETLLADLMGVSAVTLGNHEFDQGTGLIADMIAPSVNEGGTLSDIDWVGSQFPYLSANLDFSADGNLSGLATEEILEREAFLAGPQAVADGARPPKLAPAMIQEVGGEKVGVIGLTTQILESISSPGDTQVLGGGSNDMQALADIVQPIIDDLTEQGVNKIVLASHLQQIQFEEELATLLEGVDIIMAGGSNSLLADSEDVDRGLFPGAPEPYGTYPLLTQDAAGNDVAIINTDGGWRYVGQLVVEFDADGNLLTESLDPATSGVYAATDDQVSALWGDTDSAFAEGSDGAIARDLVNAVSDFVADQDGNILGLTDTYLVGERGAVRTEETNLGNLTADANLWYAQQVDAEVMVSLKNGGGIREPIGRVVVQGEDSEPSFQAPAADPTIGKPAGGVSQLDAAQTLRFNNDLAILTITRETLVEVLEHAVAASGPGMSAGQFAQVGGIQYSFDWDKPAGNRIQSAAIMDDDGEAADVLVAEGALVGSATDTLKIVTLGFLANGGDGYPFDDTTVLDRVDLVDSDLDDGLFTFADTGTEQDAFAEYMGEFFSETPFSEAETPASEDTRIQNLDIREDAVLTGVDTAPFSMDAA